MGAGILLVPMTVYLILMSLFCVKVGDSSSWKVGWLMAAALVLAPLGVFVAFLIP
ncbi:hypothetical protein OG866_20010 [Streptomyces sp. NBC_00663]|uniref:hypothetical protein n=1 Tax=Streptomyces sp. NBC_00663 TaxID=2975801 RepID=UPI002E2FBF5D|nr:hypothetical protein [Streptomyces sp. NBC_00663]